MINLDTVLKNMQTLFSSNANFDTITFVNGFTGEVKPSPLKKPTVAFSVDTMSEEDVDPVYSSATESEGELPTLLYNHVVKLRLSMNIYVPQTGNGIECYELYTKLSRYIMDSEFTLPFVGVGCGELKYDRDIGAFVLPTYLDIKETSIVD